MKKGNGLYWFATDKTLKTNKGKMFPKDLIVQLNLEKEPLYFSLSSVFLELISSRRKVKYSRNNLKVQPSQTHYLKILNVVMLKQ